ncbi:MAG: exodeoxyribonuclease III [Magnetococcus sp. WYHC-3]
MRIASWNVNSITVRLPQVLDFLARHPVDALCLQETKTVDDKFPRQPFLDIGYQAVFTGQKSYNGVAILSRSPLEEVITDLPGEPSGQRRFLAGRLGGVWLVNVYVPNGESLVSEKYPYKLAWLECLRQWLHPRAGHPVVVTGDFNIAPTDLDVHDPLLWRDRVLVSPPERQALRALLDLGLTDAHRALDSQGPGFTWWDYRTGAFQRNRGLRIDLALVSASLQPRLHACGVDREARGAERPSDHAPLLLSFAPDDTAP